MRDSMLGERGTSGIETWIGWRIDDALKEEEDTGMGRLVQWG